MFLLGESWNVTLQSPRTLFMQLHTHCKLRYFRGKQSLASVWMHTRLRDWRRVRRGWNCLSYHIIMGGGQARWKSWPTASSLKRLWAAALGLRLEKTQQLYVAQRRKKEAVWKIKLFVCVWTCSTQIVRSNGVKKNYVCIICILWILYKILELIFILGLNIFYVLICKNAIAHL